MILTIPMSLLVCAFLAFRAVARALAH